MLGEPELEKLETRIAELKEQEVEASDFDKDRIRYRIGTLTGGVATIFAGGATSIEAKERYDRVVDAVSAVRSAMEMGVVPGGGVTLVHISNSFSDSKMSPGSIFYKALKKPFLQILENGGFLVKTGSEERYLSLVGEQLRKEGDPSSFIVVNAINDTFVDWYKAGILDPVKVTLTALETSLSAAQLLMTLGGIVVNQVSEGEEQVTSMQNGILKAMNGEVE